MAATQKTTRIRKELESLEKDGYTIKILQEKPLIFHLEKDQYQFKIALPEDYPFTAPTIEILQPYSFEMNLSKPTWGPTKQILKILDSFFTSPPQYLVLGGYPITNKSSFNRTFYQYPFVSILNIAPNSGTKPFQGNYYEVNFENIPQLEAFAANNPKRFSMIFFDWSTFKFFPMDNLFQTRLQLLLKTLKEEGSLLIETPQGSMFSSDPGNTIHMVLLKKEKQMNDNKEQIKRAAQALGYTTREATSDTLKLPLVSNLYSKRERNTNGKDKPVELMVLTKAKKMGGKRKTRRLNRSTKPISR